MKTLKLLNHLCNDDDATVQTVLKWIAYPLQNPNAKMGYGIEMTAPYRAGKSLFWSAIAQVYGQYGCTMDGAQITGHFNEHWAECSLVIIDESRIYRDAAALELVNSLISSKTIVMTAFHERYRTIKSHINVALIHNYPAKLLGESNLTIMAESAAPPDGLHQSVVDEMKSGGIAALREYLMAMDLSGFNPDTKPM